LASATGVAQTKSAAEATAARRQVRQNENGSSGIADKNASAADDILDIQFSPNPAPAMLRPTVVLSTRESRPSPFELIDFRDELQDAGAKCELGVPHGRGAFISDSTPNNTRFDPIFRLVSERLTDPSPPPADKDSGLRGRIGYLRVCDRVSGISLAVSAREAGGFVGSSWICSASPIRHLAMSCKKAAQSRVTPLRFRSACILPVNLGAFRIQ
jgi:hypothetical protein